MVEIGVVYIGCEFCIYENMCARFSKPWVRGEFFCRDDLGQVKNNIKKFLGEDFMFELTDEEVEELSRCKNFTLKDEENGRGKNIKYNPHAFTEQGIQ